MCPDDPEGQEGGTDMLAMMVLVNAFAYLGCTVCALFVFALLKYFSGSFLPGEFGSLGKLKSCLGFLLRLFMQLLTLVHWLIILPDLFLLMTNFTASQCFLEKLGTQTIVFNLLPIIWLIQHLGGAIARTFIDIDTYFIIPETAEGSIFQTLCVNCGP